MAATQSLPLLHWDKDNCDLKVIVECRTFKVEEVLVFALVFH